MESSDRDRRTPAAEDDDRSVIEILKGPERPDARRRRGVIWLSMAFAAAILAMTFAVIAFYGPSLLTIITAAGLFAVIYAMIGALRYRGEDPMAQFDPPRRPKRERRRRAKRGSSRD